MRNTSGTYRQNCQVRVDVRAVVNFQRFEVDKLRDGAGKGSVDPEWRWDSGVRLIVIANKLNSMIGLEQHRVVNQSGSHVQFINILVSQF